MQAEDFEKIVKYTKTKTKKHWIIFLVIAILITIFIWYFLPTLSYNIPKTGNTDLIFRIIYTILTWIVFFTLVFRKRMHYKNRTKLPGIGFLIDTSILNGEIFEKQLFFQHFYKETEGKFKVIVYDDVKIKNKSYVSDLLTKYNLNIMFVIDELSAKKRGEELYTFSIKTVNIQFDSNFSNIEYIVEGLANDIMNAMNKYIEISVENSLYDNNKYINMLNVQTSYLMAILYIISPNPEKAFPLLDGVGYNLNNSNERSMKYIKKQLPYRYIETYFNIIFNIINESDYYKISSKIELSIQYLNNLEQYLEKSFKNNMIQKDEYIDFMDMLLHSKAIALYESGEIKKALESLYKISNSVVNTLTKQLNLAYLYGCEGNYELSYENYTKVKKRKDLNEESKIYTLNEIRDFINRHLDYNPDDIGIKFCSAITNIYFADKNLGMKQMSELSNFDSEIKDIYEELKSESK